MATARTLWPETGSRPDIEQWRIVEGDGTWHLRPDGVRLDRARQPWCALALPDRAATAIRDGDEVAIDVTVEGSAAAAGLSLGPYLDFLTPLPDGASPRRLTLELHPSRGDCTFLVDGRLTPAWWPDPPDVRRVLAGVPMLKAHAPGEVRFRDVRVRRYARPCRLSVIVTCHRFLQRLRVTLRSWCRQDAPSGSFEVLVINPSSPDGTGEHMAAVAASFPEVRVRELFLDGPAHKPVLINRGVLASGGDWVWLTDADCLFAPTAVSLVLAELDRWPAARPALLFGTRQHLRRADTDALLAMALDGIADFAALAERADAAPAEHYPWGYTQIVPRRVLLEVPYREDMPHFAHSDGAFVDGCRQRGIRPKAVAGLRCLHLTHPFAWFGTDSYC